MLFNRSLRWFAFTLKFENCYSIWSLANLFTALASATVSFVDIFQFRALYYFKISNYTFPIIIWTDLSCYLIDRSNSTYLRWNALSFFFNQSPGAGTQLRASLPPYTSELETLELSFIFLHLLYRLIQVSLSQKCLFSRTLLLPVEPYSWFKPLSLFSSLGHWDILSAGFSHLSTLPFDSILLLAVTFPKSQCNHHFLYFKPLCELAC